MKNKILISIIILFPVFIIISVITSSSGHIHKLRENNKIYNKLLKLRLNKLYNKLKIEDNDIVKKNINEKIIEYEKKSKEISELYNKKGILSNNEFKLLIMYSREYDNLYKTDPITLKEAEMIYKD